MKTRFQSISPIVAKILLVVVSAILVIIIVLNWGRVFTTSSLDKNWGIESTKSDTNALLPNILTNSGTRLYIYPIDAPITSSWAKAVSYCQNLDSIGYDDWHLPSTLQLLSILSACTKQRKSIACINAAINKGDYETEWIDISAGKYYWTSTQYKADLDGFAMAFESGGYNYKKGAYSVRCVRGG